ncbi:hypothetical protein [Methylobacterium nigriterrae]|uniref:hypothetical protein n=1 Tax=Methylobacterium nigriterrae TaxID=3127512 RepID=UPI00301321C6
MTEAEALCAELTATVHSDLAVLHPSSLSELRDAALESARSLAPQLDPLIELTLDPHAPDRITLGITWSMPQVD